MIDDFFKHEPYELARNEKQQLLLSELLYLTDFHSKGCPEYRHFLDSLDNFDMQSVRKIEDIPFFPVRLFKEISLKSLPDEQIIKKTTSSGTTSQMKSVLYIDKETAALQQKASVKQLTNFWGKKRLPFLIIDTESTISNRKQYSARASGIMGMRFFSTEMVFALDDDMNLREDVVAAFLEKHKDQPFVVFGYTFIVWQNFYKALVKSDMTLKMENAILMTGGGWKKFEDQGVSKEVFQSEMTRTCGIRRFLDHYGMAEQVASIYCECECGHLHASIFSDVIVRNPFTLEPCKIGEEGIIQVLSVLPSSYPGHSLLTEDIGMIEGEDDCPCGRKGKYIKIRGRMKKAEVRGCSDTYDPRLS